MATLSGIITPSNVLTESSTATLTNKTINAANNTVTNVPLSTGVTGTLPIANGGTGSTSTTFANLTTNVTGTLPVANGGTGAATLTANNVLLGNGTSALQAVAPGSSGNILTSNGTTWSSSAPAGGGNWDLLQTNTFSSVLNIDFANMSSTYDLYFLEGVITSTGSVNTGINYRFINSASTVITTSFYNGNQWGGEENTTNIRWASGQSSGKLTFAGYDGTNQDININMYVLRSPNNETNGVYGTILSLHSTPIAPCQFTGAWGSNTSGTLNVGGIRLLGNRFDGTERFTGTLRLWGWKKT